MDDGNQVFPQGGSAALLVIEFPSFRDFIDAYSPIISEEGIFIRNADVSESNAFSVGDRVDFEVRLKDDFRLIQGAGEVVWLGPCDAAQGAMGTAIRFHDVDEPSQRLISRLVGNHVRDGGKLFVIGGSVLGETVKTDIAPDSILESRDMPALEVPEVGSELTAEHLEASEADELFAGEDDESEAPVEFESVSLEDVERRAPGGDHPKSVLEGPVGLETIAIPSGLLANLASDGPAEVEPTEKMEAVEEAGDVEGGAQESIAAVAEDALGAEAEPFDPLVASGGLTPVDEEPKDAEAGFSAVADPPQAQEQLLDEDSNRESLEAAAVALDEQLGGGGIPDDIAQVAEELSGVHRVELPDPDEASGAGYAGSASAGSEGTGGRIAALWVIFILLGAGAFYFGVTFLGYLGWGGESDSAGAVAVRTGEIMPPASDPSQADRADLEASAAPRASDGEAEGAGSGAEGEPVAAETPEDATNLGPVQVLGERGSDQPSAGDATRRPEPQDGGTRAAAGKSTEAAPESPAAARRVESISWREEDGETIVTIRLNAGAPEPLVEVVRVRDGAPREVIKISGVEVPYTPREVAVGSRHVARLRTGLHRDGSGSALHVVADLTGAGVTVLSVDSKGRDILITFS